MTVELSEPDVKKPRLPDHVTVELKPRNNAAWTYVQTMAHNPCVRIKLHPEKHLSSVITFLNRKWKPHRLRTVSSHNKCFKFKATCFSGTTCITFNSNIKHLIAFPVFTLKTVHIMIYQFNLVAICQQLCHLLYVVLVAHA